MPDVEGRPPADDGLFPAMGRFDIELRRLSLDCRWLSSSFFILMGPKEDLSDERDLLCMT